MIQHYALAGPSQKSSQIMKEVNKKLSENGHKVHKVFMLKKYKEKEYACGSLKMKSKMDKKVGIKKAKREKLVRTRF